MSTHWGEGAYDFVRVNKAYFDRAKKSGRSVLVRTPNGETTFMPKSMKKQKVVKEVFKYKDNPMPMYELMIFHGEKKPNEYYVFSGAFI